MDLSIIIVNYNSFPLTKHCIRSIDVQHLPFKTELIVVDNNSHNRRDEFFQEEFPDVHLINSDANEGFAKAVNKGIAYARGRYILVLNPDIVVMDHAIETLYEFMEQNPRVAVTGPKIISPNGELQESCRKFITPKIILYRRSWIGQFHFASQAIERNLMAEWDHATTRDVDWIMGSSMFVRRSAIEEVGPMDERFFMYMEDMDWCRRFWEKGWRVTYLPQAQMVHYYQRMSGRANGVSILARNKLARIHLLSGFKYFWKYLGKPSTIHTISSEK